jgi:hypothetical protein
MHVWRQTGMGAQADGMGRRRAFLYRFGKTYENYVCFRLNTPCSSLLLSTEEG